VVDDSKILNLLTILDSRNISIKELKCSQLAKTVNNIRRQSTNTSISSKAKKLIQTWRNMILSSSKVAQTPRQCCQASPGETDSIYKNLSENASKISTNGHHSAVQYFKQNLSFPISVQSFHISPIEDPKNIDIRDIINRQNLAPESQAVIPSSDLGQCINGINGWPDGESRFRHWDDALDVSSRHGLKLMPYAPIDELQFWFS
ncbi:hypothetical protein HZS_5391, partial [Henneguya salminicola]